MSKIAYLCGICPNAPKYDSQIRRQICPKLKYKNKYTFLNVFKYKIQIYICICPNHSLCCMKDIPADLHSICLKVLKKIVKQEMATSSPTNTPQVMLNLWKDSGVAAEKSYSCKVILAKQHQIGSLFCSMMTTKSSLSSCC